MANNNSYDKCNLVNKQKLKEFTVNLECSVNLDTSDTVTKILAVNVEPYVGQVESLTGEASVNGNVLVNLIYLTQEGLVGNANYSSPFITKVIDNKINPNTKVYVKPLSSEAKVQSLNSNVAKVDCVISLGGFVLNTEELSYLSSVDSDVCALYDNTNFEVFSGDTKSNWLENLEVEISNRGKSSIAPMMYSCQ